MTDKSNSRINESGEILKDVSEGGEVRCPTCKGRGKVLDRKTLGANGIWFGQPPMAECRTCGGEGWVFVKNVFSE